MAWLFFVRMYLVPDLETLKYKVSSRKEGYEIRELEVLITHKYYSFNLNLGCICIIGFVIV